MPEFGEALNRYTILNFVPQQRIDDQGKTVSDPTLHAAALPVGTAVYSADSDRVHRSSPRPETGSGRFRRLRDPHRSDRLRRQIGRSGRHGARTQAAVGRTGSHRRAFALGGSRGQCWDRSPRSWRSWPRGCCGGIGGGGPGGATRTKSRARDSIKLLSRPWPQDAAADRVVFRRHLLDRAALPGRSLRPAGTGVDDRRVPRAGRIGQ